MNEEIAKIRTFTDLLAWQEAHKTAIMIYNLTKNFPNKEKYVLTNQMCRAAISVTSNIAEGFGRQGYKEKVQFYYLSQGSLTELKNQILLAKDINYMTLEEFKQISKQINLAHKLLQGLITKSKSFLNHKS